MILELYIKHKWRKDLIIYFWKNKKDPITRQRWILSIQDTKPKSWSSFPQVFGRSIARQEAQPASAWQPSRVRRHHRHEALSKAQRDAETSWPSDSNRSRLCSWEPLLCRSNRLFGLLRRWAIFDRLEDKRESEANDSRLVRHPDTDSRLFRRLFERPETCQDSTRAQNQRRVVRQYLQVNWWNRLSFY